VSKHIGIVACSSEGAALCYRTICLEAEATMGEHHHPQIFYELVKGTFTPAARARFSATIDRLASEGCDAIVMGCTEIPLLLYAEDSSLPLLDSTRILARAALARAVV
jgi:aspartate/glutamate racemase